MNNFKFLTVKFSLNDAKNIDYDGNSVLTQHILKGQQLN